MGDRRHQQLDEFNRQRLAPSFPGAGWRQELVGELKARLREGEFVESERAAVAERAQAVPERPDEFVGWFNSLATAGTGQLDALFPWLATEARLTDVKWFLRQELASDAGFDDLLALAQLELPAQPKLELARTYWDEVGRGVARGMHGPMRTRLAGALDLSAIPVVWESLALRNLMVALASNRRYAYHALGAIGVLELTAPERTRYLNRALKRLDVAPHARHYFALHAAIDIKHSTAWSREVLRPIVASEPRAALAIAEGALMRLEAGQRCIARYRWELGLGDFLAVADSALAG
ncbi:MAG: iron-containing redox enzyme family protein [Deltaproteobacteria bacterium]|nr:iron-containing redox enzyme family protein [Deltaproteobacteria bacterium]